MACLGVCGRSAPPDAKAKLVSVAAPCSRGEGYLEKRLNLLAETRLWVLSTVFHILCHLIIKSWLGISDVGASELICGSLGE